MEKLRSSIQQLKGALSINVLILGESGCGKELVAKALHAQEEQGRPFVDVNMGALPATLVEAELFGVERGAYTDARSYRAGKFELANRGDIFLDEIGELAPELQVKLLRVVQEHRLERLGSQRAVDLSFRVISASQNSLVERIGTHRFRLDLFFRLADYILEIPPLRERPEDIPSLIEHFLRRYSPSRRRCLAPSALDQLMRDRKSTRLNSSHSDRSRMPSSA